MSDVTNEKMAVGNDGRNNSPFWNGIFWNRGGTLTEVFSGVPE